MDDAYSQSAGYLEPAVVTGKSLQLWGSPGRAMATGYGLFRVLQEACRYLGLKIAGKKAAILGLSNIGSSIAKLTHKAGCQIISVTDIFGGILNFKGIDSFELKKHVNRIGSVVDFFKQNPSLVPDILANAGGIIVLILNGCTTLSDTFSLFYLATFFNRLFFFRPP